MTFIKALMTKACFLGYELPIQCSKQLTMLETFQDFLTQQWRSGVEILILWIGIYQLYRAFRATQGARILVGLTVVLIVLTLLSQVFELQVIGYILKYLAAFLALAFLIIFQPELRNALAKLGSSRLFSFSEGHHEELLQTLADSANALSKKRYGALFAIQRGIDLDDHAETGVILDSAVNQELLQTIFQPKTALHDGGVIISSNKLKAAGCVFPVSQKEISDRSLGLRHRAAIGMTESTDAIAIVVSEETGNISLAIDGEIQHGLKGSQLLELLTAALLNYEDTPAKTTDSELDS